MAARGSLFTVTMGNRRQYLKEHPVQQAQRQKGSLTGWLRLGPATEAAEGPVQTGDRTILSTRTSKAPQPSQDLLEAKNKPPMTILYDGQVRVFANVPAAQAQKLMQLAGIWLASQAPETVPSIGTVLLKRAAEVPLEEILDMPARRMAAVRRFLSKRQYRPSADYPCDKMARENQAVDLKAMSDDPSWLKL